MRTRFTVVLVMAAVAALGTGLGASPPGAPAADARSRANGLAVYIVDANQSPGTIVSVDPATGAMCDALGHVQPDRNTAG